MRQNFSSSCLLIYLHFLHGFTFSLRLTLKSALYLILSAKGAIKTILALLCCYLLHCVYVFESVANLSR